MKTCARPGITFTPGPHGPPRSELVLPGVMGSMLEFFKESGRM